MSLALVRALEERCFNAWPTLRTLHVDGWVLRLADGHTRRANSASALYPSALDAVALGEVVRARFQAQGLTPIIRVTPLADVAIAPGLERLGWREDDPSLGLYAAQLPAASMPANVLVEAKPSDAWLNDAMAAYGYGAAGAAALKRTLHNLILPAAFLTLRRDGQDIGWGLGVYERGMIGLYDLVIAPEARGKGAGRALVHGLLDWGREQGASSAYLQVRLGNAAARALYQSLGFEQAYAYRHYVLD